MNHFLMEKLFPKTLILVGAQQMQTKYYTRKLKKNKHFIFLFNLRSNKIYFWLSNLKLKKKTERTKRFWNNFKKSLTIIIKFFKLEIFSFFFFYYQNLKTLIKFKNFLIILSFISRILLKHILFNFFNFSAC